MDELCEKYRIRRVYGQPRHLQSQGQVERFNQTLTRFLSKVLYNVEDPNSLEKTWLYILDNIIYEYDISVHKAKCKSPFQMLFERNGFNDLSFDERDNLQSQLSDSDNHSMLDMTNANIKLKDKNEFHEKYITNMDKVYSKKINKELISIGDIVLNKIDYDNNIKTKKKKFDSIYHSPSIIISTEENDIILLKNSNNETEKVHISKIKKREKLLYIKNSLSRIRTHYGVVSQMRATIISA